MWHVWGTWMDLAVNLGGEGAGNQALPWEGSLWRRGDSNP
jgi:hypothetical protein